MVRPFCLNPSAQLVTGTACELPAQKYVLFTISYLQSNEPLLCGCSWMVFLGTVCTCSLPRDYIGWKENSRSKRAS
eukprot:6281469-Pyramimonas_sp.AAC.1